MRTITSQTFACRADAERAWIRWMAAKWLRRTGWTLEGQVVAIDGSGDAPETWRIEASRAVVASECLGDPGGSFGMAVGNQSVAWEAKALMFIRQHADVLAVCF